MKTTNLIVIIILIFTIDTWADKKVDPNPGFQKLIAGATRVVVRNGGDICCEPAKDTLEQEVYFQIKDAKKIKKLAENIVFIKGIEENGCLCCGHPGIDWYVGEKRVALTAYKHGFGIMRNSKISYFTPKSKVWMRKWLLKHGMKKEQLK